MNIFTRQLGVAVSVLLLSASAYGETSAVLSTPADFNVTGRYALRERLPVLVLFSSSDCGYCTFVKEGFLEPMLKSGDYEDKVLIRIVNIDSGDDVRDFSGELVDSDDFAERYDVQLTPTVTLLDNNGNELVERVVGLGTVEYYGSFLDKAIEASLKKLGHH